MFIYLKTLLCKLLHKLLTIRIKVKKPPRYTIEGIATIVADPKLVEERMREFHRALKDCEDYDENWYNINERE